MALPFTGIEQDFQINHHIFGSSKLTCFTNPKDTTTLSYKYCQITRSNDTGLTPLFISVKEHLMKGRLSTVDLLIKVACFDKK